MLQPHTIIKEKSTANLNTHPVCRNIYIYIHVCGKEIIAAVMNLFRILVVIDTITTVLPTRTLLLVPVPAALLRPAQFVVPWRIFYVLRLDSRDTIAYPVCLYQRISAIGGGGGAHLEQHSPHLP